MNLLLNSALNLILPLALIGLFGLFVVAGMIFGVVRGIKKQSFRLGWVLVITLILFFVTPVITSSFMNANLSFLNITVNEIKLTTISQFVVDYVSAMPEYGQIFADNPETINAILQIATVFLNSFIYVLLFWLAKIVLWPIWAILSAIFIKKKNAKGEKKKKHRGWGLLVGAVSGVMVGATTIMPVMGVVSIANQVEAQTMALNSDANSANDSLDNQGFITKNSPELAEMLKAYNSSFTAEFFKYTGIEFFNNTTYNALSTVTVDNQKIVLKNELSAIFKTIDGFNTISHFEFQNYTQQKLSKLFNSIGLLINNVYEIKTISVIGDRLLPYVINEILTNPNFIVKLPTTNNEITDYVIEEGLKQIKDIKFSDFKNELNCVLSIAETLNNKNVLAPILNNEASVTSVLDSLDSNTITSITNKVFEMKSLGSAMPVVINAGFMFVANYLEIENFEIDEINTTVQDVKNLINVVLNVGFEAYNTLNLDSKYYVTEQTFPLLGKVLETVKNYKGISGDNYNKLILATENRVYDSLDAMLSGVKEQYSEIKNSLLSAVHNINKITNFEQEFVQIGTIFNDAIQVIDAISNTSENLNLEQVGKVLDGIKNTKLLGDCVNSIVKSVIKMIGDKLSTDLADLKTVLNRVADNVLAVSSWQTELKNYNALYNVIEKMSKDSNLGASILEKDNTYLSEFGDSLNKLTTSVLFGNEIKNIFDVILNYVETLLPEQTNIVASAFVKIKENLQTAQHINWQTEFETIKELTLVANDFNDVTVTIEKVGERIDNIVAKNSVLITRDVINEILISVIDDFSKDISDADAMLIVANLKNTIKTSNNLCYKQEIVALNTLINEISNIDIDNFDYVRFGRMLDEFDVSSNVNPSYIISGIRTDIVKMIIGKVDTTSFPNDLKSIIEKIKSNVNNIVSYENEFSHLKLFVDETSELKNVVVDTFNFAKLGRVLDEFDDSMLLGNVRGDVVIIILNSAKDSTSDATLKQIIEGMKTGVPNIVSYEQEFISLKKFVDIRNDISNSDINTITLFGRKLDEFGTSALLLPVRPNLFNKILGQAVLAEDGMNPEIIVAINEINAQARVCGAMAENGELANNGKVMTYELIFNEFASLKDIIAKVKEVNITQDNYVLSPFGTSLDELSALNVVPKKASVRIHRFVLTEIRKAINEWYEQIKSYATQSVIDAYNNLFNYLTSGIGECSLFLAGDTQTYEKAFVTEYENIENLIKIFVTEIKSLVV